jgi:hypothetical protein
MHRPNVCACVCVCARACVRACVRVCVCVCVRVRVCNIQVHHTNKELIADTELGVCGQRTARMTEILKVLVHQFDVLETMTPQVRTDACSRMLTYAAGCGLKLLVCEALSY